MEISLIDKRQKEQVGREFFNATMFDSVRPSDLIDLIKISKELRMAKVDEYLPDKLYEVEVTIDQNICPIEPPRIKARDQVKSMAFKTLIEKIKDMRDERE